MLTSENQLRETERAEEHERDEQERRNYFHRNVFNWGYKISNLSKQGSVKYRKKTCEFHNINSDSFV